MYCYKCGGQMGSSEDFCSSCGADNFFTQGSSEETRQFIRSLDRDNYIYCCNCGSVLKAGDTACRVCGSKNVILGQILGADNYYGASTAQPGYAPGGNVYSYSSLDHPQTVQVGDTYYPEPKQTSSAKGSFGPMKVIGAVGLLPFILQLVFVLFLDMFGAKTLLVYESDTVFGVLREYNSKLGIAIEIAAIVLFVLSLVCYILPLASRKLSDERFMIAPIIFSVLLFIVFIATFLLLINAVEESELLDSISVISLTYGAWLYIPAFVLAMAAMIVLLIDLRSSRTADSLAAPVY